MPDKRKQNPGLWKKGQTGNPKGRLPRRVEDSYMDATFSRVSLDDWGEVVAKALEDAKGGDRFARDWLSKFLVPDQAIKLLLKQGEASEAPMELEITIPAPQIGPHGAQVIEGETGDGG